MKLKPIFSFAVIVILLAGMGNAFFVHAEDEENEADEYENQVNSEDLEDVTPVAQVPTITTAPSPTTNSIPTAIPFVTPVKSQSVQKIQYVEQLINKTIVPPIVILDNNENGIDDAVELLYKK